MCRITRSHILKNIIDKQTDELTNIKIDIAIKERELSDSKEKYDVLYKKVSDTNQELETSKDKLKELTIDIEDKNSELSNINSKYLGIVDSYKQKITELEKKIRELTPSDTVLFYFVGTDYKLDQNTSNTKLIDVIKTKFNEFFDKIFIRIDPSMYTTLQILKNNKAPPKIAHNKRILTGSLDAIKKQLNNGKRVILIGENFGGAAINRIIDILIKNSDSHFDIKLLDNLYSFTFGSYYCPIRLDIPSKMAEYINSSHIKNYLYDKDISAELLDNKTDIDILHSCWNSQNDRLIMWKKSDLLDPWKIHYSYNPIDIVYDFLNNKNLI